MTTYSEDFSYVYAVHEHDGKYTIDSTHPVAEDVTVSDNDAVLKHHDRFSVDANLGHGDRHHDEDKLHFVSKATDSAGDQGFIAKDSDGHYYFFTQDDLAGKHHDHLHLEHGGEHLCFMPGTMIRTPSGEAAVETLAIGDLVVTADGSSTPVRWIGRQSVARLFVDETRLPVLVRAGALADNVPARDLHLSPDHALLIDGALMQAGGLINGASITRSPIVPPMFTYYHIEVDGHALIFAEGALAETFVDNVDRMNFDNWHEREALGLFSDAIAELPYARAKARRQVPAATRKRLAERALAMSVARDVAA